MEIGASHNFFSINAYPDLFQDVPMPPGAFPANRAWRSSIKHFNTLSSFMGAFLANTSLKDILTNPS